MTFYVWDNNNKELNGEWPGKKISTYEMIDGNRWFYKTFRITSPDQYLNLIVSNQAKNKQTVNITGLRSDIYYGITGTKDENLYIVEDQTADVATGIGTVLQISPMENIRPAFNLQGMPVSSQNKKGIIIENGKKLLYR